MQPLDLKLVREAGERLIKAADDGTFALGMFDNYEKACVEFRAILDAHAALSDYDRAILAIAPYLPDGYVAQDDGAVGVDVPLPVQARHG